MMLSMYYTAKQTGSFWLVILRGTILEVTGQYLGGFQQGRYPDIAPETAQLLI